MRLTGRCIELLQLLRASRWLSTGQIHRQHFAGATKDAARKRLRKLAEGRFVVRVQEHRMQEALFTLGAAGKRVLELAGAEEVVLERRPPKQREHFMAINDLRIAAELTASLSYFFASWELPKLGWRHPIVPDAILSLRDRTFAAEIDRSHENVRFFVRTKLPGYASGFAGLPLSAVLILTDRKSRMDSLAKAIGDSSGRFLFSTVALVREQGLLASVFYRDPRGERVSLF